MAWLNLEDWDMDVAGIKEGNFRQKTNGKKINMAET